MRRKCFKGRQFLLCPTQYSAAVPSGTPGSRPGFFSPLTSHLMFLALFSFFNTSASATSHLNTLPISPSNCRNQWSSHWREDTVSTLHRKGRTIASPLALLSTSRLPPHGRVFSSVSTVSSCLSSFPAPADIFGLLYGTEYFSCSAFWAKLIDWKRVWETTEHLWLDTLSLLRTPCLGTSICRISDNICCLRHLLL